MSRELTGAKRYWKRGFVYSFAVGGALLAGAPAWALTGEDVLDKMSDDERHGYVAGLVEMAAFLSSVDGNKDRASCIMDWYYKKNGVEKIVAGLAHYRDRQALPVVHVVIKNACGK